MKTAILLATYNSEKYLSSLIVSLQEQTYDDWNLYIHDDGSTDETIAIIKKFVDKDIRIKMVLERVKFGAAKSFMELLRNTDADYYFFCDHDDIWLPYKIKKTLERLEFLTKNNEDKAIIVHSDLYVVNQNLEIINNSFWRSSKINPKILKGKNIAQVFNSVTGCTMAFNQAAKDLSFPYPNNIPMHDWWINLCVLKSDGIVDEIDESLIYYRQHDKNEVGARKINLGYFVKKLLNLNNTLQKQFLQIRFLKSINGLNFFQYYIYKLYYTVIRNF